MGQACSVCHAEWGPFWVHQSNLLSQQLTQQMPAGSVSRADALSTHWGHYFNALDTGPKPETGV